MMTDRQTEVPASITLRLRQVLGPPCLVQLLTWSHMSDYHDFGTVKDESLLTDTLASNNYLCHTNIFQNGVHSFF